METKYLQWLHEQLALRGNHLSSPEVRLGIGDDAAIIATGPQTVCCADLLAEGTHFVLDSPEMLPAVGRKALAVNLSDMAAMGAIPETALLSLLVHRKSAFDQAREVTLGLLDLADQLHVRLVGGDTCAWDGGLVINVTVNGRLMSPQPLLRSGARTGDAILVTGSLGGSIHGHHLKFTPRIREIQQYLQCVQIHAATDISDGLVRDLANILEASGKGACLFGDTIPVSAAAGNTDKPPFDWDAIVKPVLSTATDQTKPHSREEPLLKDIPVALRHALYDGEDFELILTVPADQAPALLAQQQSDKRLDCSLTLIGYVEDEPGVRLNDGGRIVSLPLVGYQH